ncbi:MAG TPA: IPT/TIG domain-containing protein, partial [Baekduia sp.]|nr:IPT/TIG domain-containing protein [Baekduia sp.]
CVSPHVDAYNKRPDPGDVITITGQDLGLSGTVALGGKSFTPTDWGQNGFKIPVPADAEGTLGLTVNCGRLSNTIAIAVFKEPDNRFSVPRRETTATGARFTVRVPGPGKLETSGARITASKVTVKKAGEVTISVRLNRAGGKALAKAKSARLKVKVGLRFTPAGGKPAAKTLTVTFQRKASR